MTFTTFTTPLYLVLKDLDQVASLARSGGFWVVSG